MTFLYQQPAAYTKRLTLLLLHLTKAQAHNNWFFDIELLNHDLVTGLLQDVTGSYAVTLWMMAQKDDELVTFTCQTPVNFLSYITYSRPQ